MCPYLFQVVRAITKSVPLGWLDGVSWSLGVLCVLMVLHVILVSVGLVSVSVLLVGGAGILPATSFTSDVNVDYQPLVVSVNGVTGDVVCGTWREQACIQ